MIVVDWSFSSENVWIPSIVTVSVSFWEMDFTLMMDVSEVIKGLVVKAWGQIGVIAKAFNVGSIIGPPAARE